MSRLNQGSKMPNFVYSTPFKSDVTLKEGLKGNKVCLLFLRYYGCTICQLDMRELKKQYDKITATGGEVKVVIQSSSEKLANEITESDFPYEIICDPELKLYNELEINAAKDMDELVSGDTMKKVGQAEAQGLQHGDYEGEELQLPAAFVIDGDFNVLYAYYGKNAGDIPTIDEIVELLK